MTSETTKKRPKFWIDMVGFSSFPLMTEVNFVVLPEYDVTAVVSSHIHEEGSRLISLKFRRVEPELGRKGYSLKQEWEQKAE